MSNAGIVAQHVNPPVRFQRSINQPLDVSLIRHISPHCNRPPTVLLDFTDQLLQPRLVPGADGNVGSFVRKAKGNLPANPTTGAGDDRDFSRQLHYLISCSLSSSITS
jgi:hypothetical protein